ncbi:MAG: MFS transporter, partial [Clostridia bacterium]|nr:MFS transporter [Clostridia bacterium]
MALSPKAPIISIFAQPLWGAAGDRAKSRNHVLRALIVFSAAVLLLYRVSSSFWWLLPVSCLFSAAYTSIQPM